MLKKSLSLVLGYTAALQAADKITYDDHIFPIFESKCLNCHNPDKKKGDLDLSTYTGTMTGSSGGKVALAGDGGTSKLYTLSVHTEEPVMPPEGDRIPKKDADLIRAWIDGGLLENKGSKAKKRKKPAFSLGAVPSGKRPEGPPPMPKDILLEPVVTPRRATVVADLEASPWAPLLAVTGQKQVLLYHSDSLELIGVLPFPKGNPETLSFHPSGKYLLAGGGIGGKSGLTVTWDITTGKEMMTMGKEFDSVLAADLRADLGGVALGGPSRLVKLWDTQEGEQIKSIKKHTDWVTALAYSPDGILLATGGRGSGVQIWEASTGNEFHSLRGHQKAIVDVKWRADSNLVASASEDGTIRFWDMNQGKEIKRGTAGGGGILALDYARNGKLISVTRDRRVKLWKPDLTLEKQSQPFPEMITEVAFSHDTGRYFTADWNGKIEAWNTTDHKKVGEINASPPSIQEQIVLATKAKETFLAALAAGKAKLTSAQNEAKNARLKLTQTEGAIAKAKQDAITHQKEANDFSAKWQKLDQQSKAKIRDRDQSTKKAKGLVPQKTQLVAKQNQLTAEQQKLGREHTTAEQALLVATQDSAKKREVANQDPNNAEKKAALAASEQAEHQQRQIVQQHATKLANQNKALAANLESIKKLDAEMRKLNELVKKQNAEHQQLITQRDQAAKGKAAKLAAMKARQAQIPGLQKQLPAQRKVIQDKEKSVATAQVEFKKLESQTAKHNRTIKKWQAAVVNTELIKARSDLAELNLKKEEDPSVAPKIKALQAKCEGLAVKYEASKN